MADPADMAKFKAHWQSTLGHSLRWRITAACGKSEILKLTPFYGERAKKPS